MRRAALALLTLAACGHDAAAPAPARDRRAAIDRAAAWLAAFPAEHLRFDAAIGLAGIRRRVDGDALARAFDLARAVADHDADNPLRRAYDDAARAPRERTSAWPVPAAGQPRVNVNRVIAEALHCTDNGLRDETLAYIDGAMRDGGGYQTAHGLWALAIARDRGCLAPARFDALAAPLVAELEGAEPSAPARPVLAVDLYAERLLMVEQAGARGPMIDAWAAHLLDGQAADGGFGELAPGDDPYFRYHATLAATWALAEWSGAR